jgi:multidrug resistance efflux pump
MSPVSVSHEAAARRAEVTIDGRTYRTKNWGVCGFSVEDYHEAATVGTTFDVNFAANLLGFTVSFSARAQAVRVDPGSLAAVFVDLGQREQDLLGHLHAALRNTAEAPRSSIAAAAAMSPAGGERTVRRWLVSAVYLTVGMVVLGFAALSVLGHFMHVNVETAVISMPLEQVVSADVGALADMNVKPGTRIAAGDVLYRIDSEASARNVHLARQELATAEIAVRQAQSRRGQEEQKLRVYRAIGNDQVEAAQAKIAALTASREQARTEFERYQKLLEYGVVSRQLYDGQKAILEEREARVAEAVAQQRISATSAQTTNSGLFFSGNFLVGDLNAAIAEESAARERLQVATAAVAQALHQESRRLYRAPFDGVVMRVFKSAGMTVDRGEALVVLRQTHQSPWIDAYLTQNEAGLLTAGSRGVAVITASGRRYPVEIVSVDRTDGFLRGVQTPKLQQPQFSWRGVDDRSAHARIAFVGLTETDRDSIEPGSPVLVTIPRKHGFFAGFLQNSRAGS